MQAISLGFLDEGIDPAQRHTDQGANEHTCQPSEGKNVEPLADESC